MTTRTLIIGIAIIGLLIAGVAYLVTRPAERDVLPLASPDDIQKRSKMRGFDAGKPACVCEPGDPLCACL